MHHKADFNKTVHNGTARIKSSTSELSQNIQNGISFDIYGAGNDLTTYCPNVQSFISQNYSNFQTLINKKLSQGKIHTTIRAKYFEISNASISQNHERVHI